MHLLHYLLPLGLLAPLAAHAQAPTPATSYYVGAGLYTSAFQNLGYHYGLTTIPVQVLAGYRWHPRWAVQVGAAYSGSSTDYEYRAIDPSNSVATTTTGHATDRRLSLTLLARRTLTRQPAHRVQFDALGGFTYERLTYREQGLYTSTYSQAPIYYPYNTRDQHDALRAGLGLGLRVRVAAPLEVTLDYLLNTAITARQYGSTLTSAAALGVRYSFGKPG